MRQRLALEGVRVTDFSWALIGSLVSKYLADHGAEVVKIESVHHPDPARVSVPFKNGEVGINRSGYFLGFNSSKRSFALNLGHPSARNLARRLISLSDVVVENFEPGTMAKWGLDYESLREIKSDIIMISLSNLGQTGLEHKRAGWGLQAAAKAGLYHLNGWPDGEPVLPAIAYADYVGAWFGVMGVLSALEFRRKTGRGQQIDISQVETVIHSLTPALLDYSSNGREQIRQGNSCPSSAPHGVYRCKGEERWCAIAVFTDGEWEWFCQAIGKPEWTKSPKFATFLARKENEDELNGLVNAWTVQHSAEDVFSILQASGIPSAVVENGQDLLDWDPQIRERGFFVPLDHPEIGMCNHNGWPAKLSKTPYKLRPAPCQGEHTEFVCSNVLGLSGEEFVTFLNDNVFE